MLPAVGTTAPQCRRSRRVGGALPTVSGKRGTGELFSVKVTSSDGKAATVTWEIDTHRTECLSVCVARGGTAVATRRPGGSSGRPSRRGIENGSLEHLAQFNTGRAATASDAAPRRLIWTLRLDRGDAAGVESPPTTKAGPRRVNGRPHGTRRD